MQPMSIRKHTEGFVDVWAGCLDSDMAPVAKNVLVFMLVGVYGPRKLPVRYFLESDLTTDLQLNLLHTCFEMKEEPEIDCVAVVCDGSYVNQSTFTRLGASFVAPDICIYTVFQKHPDP